MYCYKFVIPAIVFLGFLEIRQAYAFSPNEVIQGLSGHDILLAKKRKKRRTPRKIRKKVKSKYMKVEPLAIGIGMFSLYLPQPSLQVTKGYRRFVGGLEMGYVLLPFGEFRGTGSYFGGDVKYMITPPFYGGVGYGFRNIVVATKADFSVNGVPYEVEWTRHASQTILTPKIGWLSPLSGSTSISFATGLLMPLNSTVTIEGNPSSIEGLPEEEYEAEKAQKLEDVSKVVTSITILLELKFYWSF